MSTGLFGLFKSVGGAEEILGFLNASSYDELIEFDLNNRMFRSFSDVSKKYPMPLAEGTFDDMYINMTEILVHPEDKLRFCTLMTSLDRTLAESEVEGLICEDFRFRLLSGSYRWVELVFITGERFGLESNVFRVYIYDVHSRKARELGFTDEPLIAEDFGNEVTGLPNKRVFTKSVPKLLKNALGRWCIVSVDIENFKLFNEWHGHDRGDLLLMQIGTQLRKVSEETGGTAGYFGQDDFCLLMPYDMERIEKLYSDVTAVIAEHGNAAGFMPAFGVCVVDEDIKLRDMLDRAFFASRFAKESFHSRIRVFDSSMFNKTDSEYHILSDFMRAIKQNEFIFYLQPQVRVSTGKIIGAEALTRWKKRDGTLVPPGKFIPVLEKHGLITDLDLYIWEEVCKWLKGLIDKGVRPLPVSVNVSAIDIVNTDITAVFDGLAEKYGIPHEMIKIEITESTYIENTEYVNSTVQSLKEKGFLVLMDDFGSGYSGLNLLKTLNIDILKLDAQFLRMDKSNEKKSIQILETVSNLTQTLGIPVIFEGVESKEQKDFLKNMGCRYIQGYYFYRPMPAEDYEKLISDPEMTDASGISFKANRQFRLREILNDAIYSDSMLNSIIGPCAFYSLHGCQVDIVRFNEQFYEAVNVPDFHSRLDDIKRFMPENEHTLILELLQRAEEDRLNGSTGLLHFYKTDGTLTTFFMHFYFLRDEGENKLFYGAVQNITRLSTLEKQMALLSKFSHDTVIFLRRNPDGSTQFTVLFNGLRKLLGLSREKLEENLNALLFYKKYQANEQNTLLVGLHDKVMNSESFSGEVVVNGADGEPVTLIIYGDYIADDTGTLDYIVTLRSKEQF